MTSGEQWYKEYRNDGDGPMRFADGSRVCFIKDGPHSIVAYDVAEPDADTIIADHTAAVTAREALREAKDVMKLIRPGIHIGYAIPNQSDLTHAIEHCQHVIARLTTTQDGE